MTTPQDPEVKTDKGKERPETREQRRQRERINTEVAQTIKSLQDQFINFFMEAEDPEGQDVVEKMKSIDAKWRVYCKAKNLIPAAYPVMKTFMEASMKDYLNEKEAKLKDLQKDATSIETPLSPAGNELEELQETQERNEEKGEQIEAETA